MKPAPFDYARPRSLGEALELIRRPNARVLAGGQSLVPLLNLRMTGADLLVDVSKLPELRTIERRGDVLIVGAAVRHADFEDGAVPPVLDGALQQVAGAIAYRAVRNRGTIGGSLAHADPAADWPPVLAALGARVRVRSADASRVIEAARLVTGPLQTALDPGELIDEIEIPTGAVRVGRYKICRKPGDFAESIACVAIAKDWARVVIAGHAQSPTVLAEASAAARGRDEAPLRRAVAEDLRAFDGALSDYHRQLHLVSVVRAARELWQ